MAGEESFRMLELAFQGFNCSQILVLMGLEAQGKDNPDLVRAMTGLVGGLGCGRVCGALTGGCCLLGLYAGKGAPGEHEDGRLGLMLDNLVEWFEQQQTSRYGGANCVDIVQDDARLRLSRCPEIVLETFDKVKEILAANNYDLSQAPGCPQDL